MSTYDDEDDSWAPPPGWYPCEDREDPGSWDDPAIRDEPYPAEADR